ncbi:hypothetical protein BFX40_10380 [Mesorhizobium sp. SEMIA 3007]|nr:hypothetical protein BFX40_10380 [Mesorhizobium sp. SEMIA 3007]
MGGETRPERLAVGGGPHPKDRNEEEDPKRSEGLRDAAAGLEGSAAHPAPPGTANGQTAPADRAATVSSRQAARARGRSRMAETA